MVTIILPVSRPDYLKRIFAQLELMACDATKTNLFVYVDGNLQLFEIARNLTVQSKFNQKLCVFRRKGIPDIASVVKRRQRISDIHNEIKEYVNKCEYVFLIEDDTLIPTNTFEKMQKNYVQKPHAGLITGVQINRWGFNTTGIWHVDNPYDIKEIKSLVPPVNTMQKLFTEQPKTFQEIDAAGFYCMFTSWELYQSVSHKPFAPILGPDVNYGIELRTKGYKNYVDWSINTIHLTKKGEIKVFDNPVQQVTFTSSPEGWSKIVL